MKCHMSSHAKGSGGLKEQLAIFERQASDQRELGRTRNCRSIEMLREMGYTNGVENYSRHMDGREGEYLYPSFFLMIS